MTEKEILELRDLAEVGKVQFKERIVDNYDIACEMCALSNYRGGRIVIGINDKTGSINPLSFQETQETTQMLGNIASTMLNPSILIETDTSKVEGGNLVIATVKEGTNKPYHDNKGIIWVKQGADKRKIFDNMELKAMMDDCGTFEADEAVAPDASMDDMDMDSIKTFLLKKFRDALPKQTEDGRKPADLTADEIASLLIKDKTAADILRNLKLIRPDGRFTVAAVVLFAKVTQRFIPTYTAKCISFFGNSVGGSEYRDRFSDTAMEGNILHQYNAIMQFFTRNLRNVQVEENFNSLGELEIPSVALMEFTANALVHRSLVWTMPVRVFIFDDRVEIHSPGNLPAGMTVESVVSGVSMPRNNLLFDNAIFLLPYTGAGSGLKRALETGIEVQFNDNEKTKEFVITIPRKEHHINAPTSEIRHQPQGENAPSSGETHQPQGENAPSSGETHQPQGENAPTKLKVHKVSQKVQDILNFCSIPRTAQEIMNRLGIQNQSRSRKRYIQALIDAGLLERTIPENPNDPNQKYRRVRK